jgi:proton glutamate symport protein
MTNPIPKTSHGQEFPAKHVLLVFGLVLFLGGALLTALYPSHAWIVAVRWVGIAILAAAGARRSTLTYWIFFSMLVGIEIGLDRPQLAEHLRVFSDIFLRLIKVIVAPLIIGTLVTGIAGHGNLRSVGRIGVKSLIYFEVVTTLALFIGLIGKAQCLQNKGGHPSLALLTSRV